MTDEPALLQKVRIAAARKTLFLAHAVAQMSRPDRMIGASEVRAVIDGGEIIEDYPEDVRGHSCLMLGLGSGNRPVHVVCSPKEDYLAVITAYLPDPEEWTGDFRRRAKR
jgi:hypothetical protein